MSHTTLVLGAGASVAMNYPVGDGLRNTIINEAVSTYGAHISKAKTGIYRDHLNEFTEEFRNSQMASIDAFLARRPEYAEIGKLTIAAILLDRENKDLLHSCDHKDHWYQYFFNRIASHSWESLSFQRIAIVTFNYDRSLEHYLAKAMMASYKKSFVECCEKLKELRIVHVYGSIGPCNPNDPLYFSYGEPLNSSNIAVAAAGLKVIPEGRQEDESLIKARDLLITADKIAFLGFSFDEINLERLDSSVTCQETVKRQNGTLMRTVTGTSLGLTNAEATKAVRLTAGGKYARDPASMLHGIGCLGMLRETLILEP